MRYLTLSTDYNSFLKDDFDSNFSVKELGIPDSLLDEIIIWYKEYHPYILMDSNERRLKYSEIDKLDLKGKNLALAITKSINEDVKIRYYSEGRLKYL
jgi:hypothetical protein